MNTLSWLIYWAGVVGAMNGFFIFIAVVAGVASVAGIIAAIIATGSLHSADKNEAASWAEVHPVICRYRNVALGVFSIMSALALFTPDKQTIVMIGASEFGQRAIQSEAVQRLADPSVAYIETWLRGEIEKMTPRPNNSR